MFNKSGCFYFLDHEGQVTHKSNETLTINEKHSTHTKVLAIADKRNLVEEYIHCLNNATTPIIVNPDIPSEKIEELEKRLIEKNITNKQLGHVTCSSGTTSSTGPIKAFHFQIDRPIANAKSHYDSLGINTSLNILFPMPLTHSFGVVVGILGTMELNHNLYTFNDTPKNDILINSISEFDIDLLYLTPTLARLLMKFLKRKKITVEKELKISIGAAHIYKSEILELMNYFPNSKFYYTYGLSEVGPRVSTLECGNLTNSPLLSIESETLPIGSPLEGVKFLIEDTTLRVQSSYANSLIEQGAYFNTQDEANEINENIFLRGRKDNTINFAGVNIYPQEIEPIINSITGKKSVLIGMPSKLQGEVPVLVIEATATNQDDFDQKAFISELSKSVPVNLHPQRIFFLEKFPQTNMGKIKRKQILKEIS